METFEKEHESVVLKTLLEQHQQYLSWRWHPAAESAVSETMPEKLTTYERDLCVRHRW
jgi:hypothetical protein